MTPKKKKYYEEEPEEENNEDSDSIGTLLIFSVCGGVLLNITVIIFNFFNDIVDHLFSWQSLITTICLSLFIFVVLIAITTATKHKQPTTPTEQKTEEPTTENEQKKEG